MARTRVILISTLAIVLGVGAFGAVLLTRFWNASLLLVAEREALFAESRAGLIRAELTRIEEAIGRLSRLAESDGAGGDGGRDRVPLHLARQSALYGMTAAIVDPEGRVSWTEDAALPAAADLSLRRIAREATDGQVHAALAGNHILISSATRDGGALVGVIDPSTPHFLGPNMIRYLGRTGVLRLRDDTNRLVATVGGISPRPLPDLPAWTDQAPPRPGTRAGAGAGAGAGSDGGGLVAAQRWVADTGGREWLQTLAPIGFLGLRMDLVQAVDEIDDPVARPFRSLVVIVAIELLAAVAAGGLLARALGRIHDFERALSRAEQLAAMGRTTAAIAHELKNALNGLSVAVDLVASGTAPPDKAAGIRGQIRSEMDRLRRITDDLTFFSGPARLELAPVDLVDLLRRVPAVLADRIVDEGVTVDLDVRAGDRPGGADDAAEDDANGGLQVRGDAHRLLGVFVNLAHNAIDAMRAVTFQALPPDALPGGAAAAVSSAAPERPCRLLISARADAGHAILEFTDCGAGIAPEVRTTMFDPFVTTKRTGTGLGLAIARKVVEAHGGEITARDATGGGTTFTVKLPRGAPPRGGA